jgi:hypothetical protein
VIVVLGSRHDPVAIDLVGRWPPAALCSAEDLTRRGWAWAVSASAGRGSWVVDGLVIPDEEVTGVFVRRSTVHPEELTSTHPDDRTYLAAEAHAFLVHVLASTRAMVANPVDDGGAFGEAALRPEHWMAAAEAAGVAVAPLRVRSTGGDRPPEAAIEVELVGTDVLGAAPPTLMDAARMVGGRLGLRWAVLTFDDDERLFAITTTPAPTPDAAARLGELLGSARAA